jgi:hypothetical protein
MLFSPGMLPDGRAQSIRHAIAEQQGEALIDNVVSEIERSLLAGADQVIFFAQDKAFLRALEADLTGNASARQFCNEIRLPFWIRV